MNMYVSEVEIKSIEPDRLLIAGLLSKFDNGLISIKMCCASYHESMMRKLCGVDNLSASSDTLILELVDEEIELGLFSLEESCERYHELMVSTMSTELKDYETPLLSQSNVVLTMLLDRVGAGVMTQRDCCVRFNELMSRSDRELISALEVDQRRYDAVKNMEPSELASILGACEDDSSEFDQIIDQMSA